MFDVMRNMAILSPTISTYSNGQYCPAVRPKGSICLLVKTTVRGRCRVEKGQGRRIISNDTNISKIKFCGERRSIARHLDTIPDRPISRYLGENKWENNLKI